VIKIQNVNKDKDLLVTAKEFIKGEKGEPGKDGYTPIKGVDYFDGEPGKDGNPGPQGEPGKDGYTPVKGVDYFDGENGADGKDGAPGKSGVHVGTEEPEDEEIVVWIDTAGESDELEAAEGGSY
jgi:hypothetical protein